MAVTVALIKRLTKAPTTYYAGYRDYRAKGVLSFQEDEGEEETYIWGRVADEHYQQHDVGVALNPETGNPKWFRCTCSDAQSGKGLCRHGVALLLRYCDEKAVSELISASALLEKQPTTYTVTEDQPRKTDFLAAMMLGRYREEETAHMLASSLSQEEHLTAQPHLSFDQNDQPQIYKGKIPRIKAGPAVKLDGPLLANVLCSRGDLG